MLWQPLRITTSVSESTLNWKLLINDLSFPEQYTCHTEKAMATQSSTLAWKIPWMEESGRLQTMGSRRVDTTERLHFHFSLPCIGEGNGNPLQCSCLENPRDGGAWGAAVYGVAQRWTRLKWLSSSSSSSIPVTNLLTTENLTISSPSKDSGQSS